MVPLNNSKPKLLHLTASLGSGGAEQMLLRTLPKLNEFSHTVCCLGKRGVIGDQLEQKGIPIFYIQKYCPLLNLSAMLLFRDIIRQINPDIIITYLPLADLFGKIFGKLFGIKIVICSLRSTLRDIRYWPLIAMEIITSPLATHYIAVSNAVKNRFARLGLSFSKITAIPNGIPLEEFAKTSMPLDRNAIRKKFNLSPDDCVAVIIGNLRKEKGHKYVLRSLIKTSPDTLQKIRLLLVGDGPERKRLEHLARKLNLEKHARFLGFRKNIFQILSACDIAISSSLYEGMSNALLEVMAGGLAVIAINTPENREILTNNSGMLVQPKSTSDLARALNSLVRDSQLRETLGKNARERVQNFSINQTTAQLSKLFFSFLLKK